MGRAERDNFNSLRMTLVAGEGYGKASPLPVHSPLFMVDVQVQEDTTLRVAGELKGEIAIVVTKGEARAEDEVVEAGGEC